MRFRIRTALLSAGWALVFLFAPAVSCPAAAPPATLPLPTTADPPSRHELRATVATGVGSSDLKGSVYAGGAIRGTYAPLRGMIIGFELGGGAQHNTAAREAETGLKRESVLSGRLLVGYGFWMVRSIFSLAAEIGLSPGLHSEYGGFIGPDFTLSVTAGGRFWWALTATYRITYVLPTRDVDWSAGLYHITALTLLIPRRARYAGFLQFGLHYGHRMTDDREGLGLAGVVGFRFTYGFAR